MGGISIDLPAVYKNIARMSDDTAISEVASFGTSYGQDPTVNDRVSWGQYRLTISGNNIKVATPGTSIGINMSQILLTYTN